MSDNDNDDIPVYGHFHTELRKIGVVEGVGSLDIIYFDLKDFLGVEALGEARYKAFGSSISMKLEVPKGTTWALLKAMGVNVEHVHLTHVPKRGSVIRQMGPLLEYQKED